MTAVITEDQSEVIAFLEAPSTHGGAAVERIDTHASVVFLAGNRAWKLKRAVLYDFLDFSTAARRREMCEAELRVNRHMSPSLYRGVVAITRERSGALTLGGTGTAVDWLIEMVRFDQEQLFDRLAERGSLPTDWMRPLAAAIATMHDAAEHRTDRGGAAGMQWVIDGNELAFREQLAASFDRSKSAALTAAGLDELERHRALLESRRATGFVRRCHGDLHLRNIVLLDGQPTLFDAIEFNEAISCIDVLYDVAFLLMDLWHRQLPHHANLVWNAYLSETSDFDGLPLMPLFLSCRAAVRAKTEAIEAQVQHDPARRPALEDAAQQYLQMAVEFLRPERPVLVAVGGLSGSGKSTLAHRVAPSLGSAPGAVVLRSDEIRKRLCGVGPFDRLGVEGYTPDLSALVYAELFESASKAIRSGHAAIADAVFARPSDRDAIERAASDAGVLFVGVWLDATDTALLARAAGRGRDPSDANADVVRAQLADDVGPIRWHRVDASPPAAIVQRQAQSLLAAMNAPVAASQR